MSLSSVTRVREVNCRYKTTTGSSTDGDVCSSLAKKYETTVEAIVNLNPTLNKDCNASIKPSTSYCVKGFIEPDRAWDGLCGPTRNNTCLGTDKQCCNSETWKCGKAEEDCQAGNCYEGACFDK
ncbi:unnamed protein product [Clonostachys chloroleuca]|uniref:LysM domain-containing protein n=1 Tax=Clonostachys chloroleuca TaxID=1926264 RepID=A0AA35QFC6_9HYPO|nr:unnamed protein product [Clonostachys chloroleuca]